MTRTYSGFTIAGSLKWRKIIGTSMRITVFTCLAVLAGMFAPIAHACGPETDCEIGDRVYRIRMPAEASGPVPVLLFAHGYRGSAAGPMRNANFERLANDLGAALIAVKSKGPDWDLPGTPSGASKGDFAGELQYFDNVLTDAGTRFDLDLDRVVATGFSAGGMMVWSLACYQSENYAGFIPISGTFWKPEPASCETPPAKIIHVHGNADRTVPLGGRKIGPAHQGDVPTVLEMYADYGAYGYAMQARRGNLNCLERTNATGEILDFCRFDGGHSFSVAYIRHGWERIFGE